MPCLLSKRIISDSSLYMLGDGSLYKVKLPLSIILGIQFSSKMDLHLALKSQLSPSVLQILLQLSGKKSLLFCAEAVFGGLLEVVRRKGLKKCLLLLLNQCKPDP